MRQDAAFQPGEAISQKVVGGLLASDFDCIVAIDAHLHRTSDIREVFPGIEAETCRPCQLLSIYYTPPSSIGRQSGGWPDTESEVWVSDLADVLNCPT